MILDTLGEHIYEIGRDAKKAEYAVQESIDNLSIKPDSESELLLEMALDFCRAIQRRERVLTAILPKAMISFKTGADTATLMPDTAKE